jgi:hypothetical protein
MKVSDLNLNQVNGNSFVNLNSSWNKVQIQAFQQSMQADPKAMSTASSLNAMMQERGVLPQGQQVVGAFGGKFFTINANSANGSANRSATGNTTGNTTGNATGNATGNTNSNSTTNANGTNSGTGNTNGSMPTADNMVQGLASANPTNITNIHAKNVIDINGSMSPAQIRSLVKSLDSNSTARKNADSLTQQLRRNGMLGQNQSVLGMANGNVFTGRSNAGNSQGGSSSGSAGGSSDDDTSSTTDTNRRKEE